MIEKELGKKQSSMQFGTPIAGTRVFGIGTAENRNTAKQSMGQCLTNFLKLLYKIYIKNFP